MKISINSLKTPLRYPGGKSRALKKLFKYIPDLHEYEEFREPFLGGGSVSLEVTKRYPNLRIIVNDLYKPLFIFWQQLQDHGDKLSEELRQVKTTYNNQDKARFLFDISKLHLHSGWEGSLSDFEIAVNFYIVNKCSYSGLSENSTFSPQASDSNFTIRNIDKLKWYQELIQTWEITNQSYETLLTNNKNIFVYLDPPYEISDSLYGKKGNMHKNFDHDLFAEDCQNNKCHQLISYYSSQLIKDRFKDWYSDEFAHTYTMVSNEKYTNNQSKRNELVLYNYKTIEQLKLF